MAEPAAVPSRPAGDASTSPAPDVVPILGPRPGTGPCAAAATTGLTVVGTGAAGVASVGGTVRLHRRVAQPPAPARVADAVRVVAETRTTELAFDALALRLAQAVRSAVVPEGEVGLHPVDALGRPLAPTSTAEATAAVDRAQHEAGVGPCAATLADGRAVRVDDVRSRRHAGTAFAAAATAAGVGAALVVPLALPDGERVGALALYAPCPGALDRGHEAAARQLAAPVAVAFADARAYGESAGEVAGLRQAMASRAVIEQAKGMLIASGGCTPDEAFAILVRASQRENSKLRDVARRLVEGARDRGPG